MISLDMLAPWAIGSGLIAPWEILGVILAVTVLAGLVWWLVGICDRGYDLPAPDPDRDGKGE